MARLRRPRLTATRVVRPLIRPKRRRHGRESLRLPGSRSRMRVHYPRRTAAPSRCGPTRRRSGRARTPHCRSPHRRLPRPHQRSFRSHWLFVTAVGPRRRPVRPPLRLRRHRPSRRPSRLPVRLLRRCRRRRPPGSERHDARLDRRRADYGSSLHCPGDRSARFVIAENGSIDRLEFILPRRAVAAAGIRTPIRSLSGEYHRRFGRLVERELD